MSEVPSGDAPPQAAGLPSAGQPEPAAGPAQPSPGSDPGGGAPADSGAAGEPSFEESFRELEETVHKLEGGDLDLETSIALFERGIELARRCEAMLDQAELKVHELMPDLAPPEEQP